MKKGVMRVSSNYRGISISANMSRILAKVILNRLKDACENHLGETQFWFRKNRSTGDAIFVPKSVIENLQCNYDLADTEFADSYRY